MKRRIVIKQADKGFCMVVWGGEDYIKIAVKQLRISQTLIIKKPYYQTWLKKVTSF